MKTVITKTIDGHDIIVGFGRLAIEPVETKKAVAAIQHLEPEMQAADAKRAEMSQALQAANLKFIQYQATGATHVFAEWKGLLEQAKELEAELKELLPAVEVKRRELMMQHARYFEPKKGEEPRSGEEIAVLEAAMAQGGFVNLEGAQVQDNRGVIHCLLSAGVWKIKKILTLGEEIPAKAIRYEALSTDQLSEVTLQLEKNAATVMSAGERANAKATALDLAVKMAASYRSELEIQGDSDALTKAQDQYEARKTEIEGVYDVSHIS